MMKSNNCKCDTYQNLRNDEIVYSSDDNSGCITKSHSIKSCNDFKSLEDNNRLKNAENIILDFIKVLKAEGRDPDLQIEILKKALKYIERYDLK